MFCGQPYCKSCDYSGPDYMWSWHNFWGVGVLVQNQKTRALRVIHVPDPGNFTRKNFPDESAASEAWQTYVESVVAKQLQPDEREIPLSEFFPIVAKGELDRPTGISCPSCGSLLFWKETGIS